VDSKSFIPAGSQKGEKRKWQFRKKLYELASVPTNFGTITKNIRVDPAKLL